MKWVDRVYHDCIRVIVGTVEEIRAVRKSMFRAWREDRSDIWPSHLDEPIFRPFGVYGIGIYREEHHDVFYILNSDTILKEIGLCN